MQTELDGGCTLCGLCCPEPLGGAAAPPYRQCERFCDASTLRLAGAELFHGQQHLAHGGGQADNDSAADDAVADVQFHQMRHLAAARQDSGSSSRGRR